MNRTYNLITKYKYKSKHCGRCPSKDGPDPMSKDFMKLDKKTRMSDDCLFPCAWDKEYICLGILKLMVRGAKWTE